MFHIKQTARGPLKSNLYLSYSLVTQKHAVVLTERFTFHSSLTSVCVMCTARHTTKHWLVWHFPTVPTYRHNDKKSRLALSFYNFVNVADRDMVLLNSQVISHYLFMSKLGFFCQPVVLLPRSFLTYLLTK